MRVSALAHATEDLEKVAQAMVASCPEDFPQKVQTLRVKGYHGNEIIICRLAANGRHYAERFVDHFWESLGDSDRKVLFAGLDECLDSAGNLHLRIDKQKAWEGQVILGGEDHVKVEISFRSPGAAQPLVEAVRNRVSIQASAVQPSSSSDDGDGPAQ